MYSYSPRANSFFIDGISSSIPGDVIAVDDSEYEKVTVNSSFMPNRLGYPIATERRPSEFHTWDGAEWIIDDAASAALSEQLMREEITAAVLRKKQLLRIATDEIAWRQDAEDAGIATDNEIAALTAWKQYRVMLMRVETSNPDVVWPAVPV